MTRDEVIKALEGCICGNFCEDCICYPDRMECEGDVIDCMEALMRKVVDLLKAEPKRGRWVPETDRERHWHCSVCGYVAGIAARTFKYCPECGTRNTEADDGNDEG